VNVNKCYHCKKEGHTRKYCPQRQKKAKNLDRPFRSSKRLDEPFTYGGATLVEDDYESS